jgi:hypothetical protein
MLGENKAGKADIVLLRFALVKIKITQSIN